jgi:predicted GNAT family acetyltransferase
VAARLRRGAGLPPCRTTTLRARLDSGSLLLWLDADGTPVAGRPRTASGDAPGTVARIGPVWTPPQHRRQGYAAAVTGHVAAQLASTGATVMLFTDASNPTSNGVYARLGFRVVGAWLQLALA